MCFWIAATGFNTDGKLDTNADPMSSAWDFAMGYVSNSSYYAESGAICVSVSARYCIQHGVRYIACVCTWYISKRRIHTVQLGRYKQDKRKVKPQYSPRSKLG